MLGFGPLGARAFGELPLALQQVVSTHFIQKPVDCVVEWEHKLGESWSENDIGPRRKTEKTKVTASGVKLFGNAPTFTVTTSKRGYD